MTAKKVVTILGTRPEIVKLSALLPLLDDENTIDHILIHTGQHYDYEMDNVFFDELKLKQPDYQLDIGSHSQGKQTGMMLQKIEEVLLKEKPVLVLVHGDTNSTLAGALAASKLGIKVVHIEAGCRSFNKNMPEEINRIIVDHVSTYLIAPDEQSMVQLKNEGISSANIFRCGSTVFDIVSRLKSFEFIDIPYRTMLKNTGIHDFALVTIHRAENTKPERLASLIETLNELAVHISIVFPVHPRTLEVIKENNLDVRNIKIIDPAPPVTFISLLKNARFCITDSGGVQEEAVALNIPCIIPRKQTEWMRYVTQGKTFLAYEKSDILSIAKKLLDDTEIFKIKNISMDLDSGASTMIMSKIMELVKRES